MIVKFRTKLTISFLFALILVVAVDNYFIYRFNYNIQFQDLRNKLTSISEISSLLIDADKLQSVALKRESFYSPQYSEIAKTLRLIKKSNSSIKYIYTITKTAVPGVWRFIVDPDPLVRKGRSVITASSFPGDVYDATRVPEMLAAYNGPTADKQITVDEWGASLSGYAPIKNKLGITVAVLGIDIDASQVYAIQKSTLLRAGFVLFLGIIFSLLLAFFISRRISQPINELISGARTIALGNLDYQVKVMGKDEIAQLAQEFNQMAVSLKKANKKLKNYFYGIVQSLVKSLEAKDHYTRGHSDRVSEYSVKIAQEMGLPQERIEMLKKAAQLHDIGKIGVREQILNKKGPLDDQERDLINNHPAVGEEILKPVFDDPDMLAAVKSHHEYFDGTGYPEHLSKDQINIFAQIVAVADAYDAMTSTRSYRPAMSKEDALVKIKEQNGVQFNPEVVKALIKALN
ncbi:MAG: HD domain-containing phosphohydrolase [Candidatus Omnitrophota bacterium]